MIDIYTENELRELHRAVYDFAAEELVWQILYIEAVAHNTPNRKAVREKLLSLPKTFELIIRNSVHDSPAVNELTKAVYEGNRLFIQYVDAVFRNGNNESTLVSKLHEIIHSIAECLNQMNPQWGIAEWMTLIHHQIKLMDTVMNDTKDGNKDILTEILPQIRRLKMDMAEYLAHGIGTCNRPDEQDSPNLKEDIPAG